MTYSKDLYTGKPKGYKYWVFRLDGKGFFPVRGSYGAAKNTCLAACKKRGVKLVELYSSKPAVRPAAKA